MNEALLNYGALGICVAGMAYWIMTQRKDTQAQIKGLEEAHREERKEWKQTIEKQFDEANRNIKDNTNIVSKLTTLLENRK